MRIKEYIEKLIGETRAYYYKMRIYAVIPFVWIFMLLLAWNSHDILYPNRFSKYFINERVLTLLPIGIAGMVFLYLRENIDGLGRELLYLYEEKKIFSITWMCIRYSVLFWVSDMLFYRKILKDDNWLVCLKAVLLVFAAAFLLYALMYFMKSVSLALTTFAAVYLACYMLSSYEVIRIFRYDYREASCLLLCVGLLLCSLFVSRVGAWLRSSIVYHI